MTSLRLANSRRQIRMTNQEWRTRLLIAEPNYLYATVSSPFDESNRFFFSNLLRSYAEKRQEFDRREHFSEPEMIAITKRKSAFHVPAWHSSIPDINTNQNRRRRRQKFDIASVIGFADTSSNRLSTHYALRNLKKIYTNCLNKSTRRFNTEDEIINVEID